MDFAPLLGRTSLVLAALCWPTLGSALKPTPNNPLDPLAPVPPLVYPSPWAHTAPRNAEPVSWKAANDTVGRIGGWRTYAREASAPAHTPAPAASSASQPESAR